MELLPGDKVYCHHFIADKNNRILIYDEKLSKLNYGMIYARVRDGKIHMLSDWVLLEIVKDKEEATGASTFALWVYQSGVGVEDTECADYWCEVSDLTGVPVWVYQELKSYAVAIGWKTDDQDLFI